MEISEQTFKRMVAFISCVARDCKSCLRRNDDNCGRCRSTWARSVLADAESETRDSTPAVDCSLEARIRRIIDILRKAERPLASREIDLKDVCSPQLKMWTLNRLVDGGFVKRSVVPGKGKNSYRYQLGQLGNKKETK